MFPNVTFGQLEIFVISLNVIFVFNFGPEPSSGLNPRIAISSACQRLGRTDHTTGLFLEATDRPAVRTKVVVVRREDIAIVVEVQVVRVVAVRSN